MHLKKTYVTVLLTSTLLAACTMPTGTETVSSAAPPIINKVTQPLTVLGPKAQNDHTTNLTLKQIMADPDWIGNQPENEYWTDNSQQIIYSRKREGSVLSDLWLKSIDEEGNGRVIPLNELHQYGSSRQVFSQDRQSSAWIFKGNVFYKNHQSGVVKQLSKDVLIAENIQFLTNGHLSFQVGDSVIVIDPKTGLRETRVSWQFDEQPKPNELAKDYIAKQQQALISVVAKKRADRLAKFEYTQQLQQQNSAVTAQPFYLPKDFKTIEASLSPNGQWLLLVVQENSAERSQSDLMPNYINDDGRISSVDVRGRVADAQPLEQSLWLLDLTQHDAKHLSYNELPGYNEDVLAEVKRENAAAKGQSYQDNRLPRTIRLIDDWYWQQSAVQWNNDGEKVAIMLEAADNKDRWLTTLDTQDSRLVTQHRLHDDAWINYKMNDFGWLNNTDALYYLSEESGYSQLYIKPINGKARAMTQGQYEVSSVRFSDDDRYAYFKANKKHPGIYEIYRVDIQDGQLEELTDLNGMTDFQLSPDEQTLLLTHSKLTMPPELYLQKLDGSPAKQITHTVSEKFLAIDWLTPDIVPIQSSHSSQAIYARLYARPSTKGEAKRKAVLFNHGAGYLQNSHLGWSAYFREFMFHNLLVQNGYVVLDMDYRASAGYGRDWRTAIYRHMGKPEIEDLRDGVNWLVDKVDVDRNRIGTYGGSYGGFLTFMSLFTAPDLFKAGAALRPVSDWAHYNFGYTSNILNTPDDDPIAYKRSSPIYFAEGLQAELLINAPMVDSNVFFQDTVRLVQRLIELEKANFETAIYPVESHGFVEPSSWLDEYRRIYKLFEQNL